MNGDTVGPAFQTKRDGARSAAKLKSRAEHEVAARLAPPPRAALGALERCDAALPSRGAALEEVRSGAGCRLGVEEDVSASVYADERTVRDALRFKGVSVTL